MGLLERIERLLEAGGCNFSNFHDLRTNILYKYVRFWSVFCPKSEDAKIEGKYTALMLLGQFGMRWFQGAVIEKAAWENCFGAVFFVTNLGAVVVGRNGRAAIFTGEINERK